MKTVLLSGSSGFIGSSFSQRFSQKYKFVQLSHTKRHGHITLEQLATDKDLQNSIDIVINLAGANIVAKRWSANRKAELLNSRIDTTEELVAIFNKAEARVHFISASAVGIYPPNSENDENTPIDYHQYTNFSQQITCHWEQAASVYHGALTVTRLGVVLGSSGGAFPQMLRPFLFFAGGPLGHGTQYFPWISLTDLLNALDYIINLKHTGIYNLVAPQMITNNELCFQIARIWHRPNQFRMPEFMIKLIFGQMGQELFLNSLKVSPQRLLAEGFKYQCPKIEDCLLTIKSDLNY
jgi:uncharacterized protein (TIGR01777 family)